MTNENKLHQAKDNILKHFNNGMLTEQEKNQRLASINKSLARLEKLDRQVQRKHCKELTPAKLSFRN